jgi:hypothetical protein
VGSTESKNLLSPQGNVASLRTQSLAAPEEPVFVPRVPWPFRPLVWLNQAFDWSTAWLGPLGRWLRGPSGQALLGWSGLLMLAAALAWLALDTLGWSW